MQAVVKDSAYQLTTFLHECFPDGFVIYFRELADIPGQMPDLREGFDDRESGLNGRPTFENGRQHIQALFREGARDLNLPVSD